MSPSQQFSTKQKQKQQVQMDEQERGDGGGFPGGLAGNCQEGQQGTSCRGSVKSDWDSQCPSRALWPSQASTEGGMDLRKL